MKMKKALRYILALLVLGLFIYNKGTALYAAVSQNTKGIKNLHVDHYSAFFCDSHNNERSYFKRKYKPRGVEVDVPQILNPFTFRSYIPFIFSTPASKDAHLNVNSSSHPKRGPPVV